MCRVVCVPTQVAELDYALVTTTADPGPVHAQRAQLEQRLRSSTPYVLIFVLLSRKTWGVGGRVRGALYFAIPHDYKSQS